MLGALPFIDLFGDGVPPVQGGVLDQSSWFVSAYRRLKFEENLIQLEAAKDG